MARHAFGVQGYSGATRRGIAKDAGLTSMSLYNYVSSKAELFAMVWQESSLVYQGAAAAKWAIRRAFGTAEPFSPETSA